MVRMDASTTHELSGYGSLRKGIHQPWTATQTPMDSLWIAWIPRSTPRTDSVDLSEYAVDIEDTGSMSISRSILYQSINQQLCAGSSSSTAPASTPSTSANAVAPLTAPIETTKTEI